MRVTFLGTGSAMPTGDRAQTGLLVADGERRVLLDCGSGVLHRLAGTDAGYEGVNAVLLTHHHTDHVADLVPLLKARWLADADELPIVGPRGTGALVDDLLGAHDYLRDRVAYRVREIEPGRGRFTVAGFDVSVRETRHSMRCLAYAFGGTFAFSGDTEASGELAAFAEGVDAMAHDCSFPDEVDVSNHPTPSQLGAALAGHDVGTVYLTHFYPHARGRETEMAAAVARRYGGDVEAARDGLTVTVGGT